MKAVPDIPNPFSLFPSGAHLECH